MLSPFIPITGPFQTSETTDFNRTDKESSMDIEEEPTKEQNSDSKSLDDELMDESLVVIKEEESKVDGSFIITGEVIAETGANNNEEEETITIVEEDEYAETESLVFITDEKDTNIISILKNGHDKVKQLYDNFQCESSLEKKVKMRDTIVEEILLQYECQQSTLYPLLKEMKFDKERIDLCNKADETNRVKLEEIRTVNIDEDLGFDQMMEQIMASVIMHMDLEELNIVSFLKKCCTEKDLQDIGATYARKRADSVKK